MGYTVDLGSSKVAQMGRCAAAVDAAHARLKTLPNVEPLIGDSMTMLPKLVAQHRGKRIGLFIDGPKGLMAINLCLGCMKRSKDVRFCAFHDVKPDKGATSVDMLRKLEGWGRTVLLAYRASNLPHVPRGNSS